MTKEQLDRIYGIDTVSEPVQKKSSLTKDTLDSIYNGTYETPNKKRKQNNLKKTTVNVGAEDYNSAPLNLAENNIQQEVNVPKVLEKSSDNKLDMWLNPSYKLSKDEKKEAKAYVKQWYKDNAGFQNNPYESQEQTEELKKIAELNSKLSGGTAAWSGFTNAIPFLENIQDKISNAFGGETSDAVSKNREALEASKMQNPGAAIAGNVAGELAKYSAGGELLKGAGLIGEGGKLTQGVSKVIKNPKVAGSVANILGDTSLDAALDTIPHLVEDISKGEEKAGVNALKNVGTNLALNMLGEGVGIAGGKVIGKLADKKQPSKLKSLNPLEEHVNAAEEIVKGSDDLQKQIFESSQKSTDSLTGQNAAANNVITSKAPKKYVDPADKVLMKKDLTSSHSAEEIENIKSYVNSTDNKIVEFSRKVLSDKQANKKAVFDLKPLSDRLANDYERLTGIKTHGNRLELDADTVIHIDNNHGSSNDSNHSMADENSLARIQYVLDNYDEAFLANKNDATTGKLSLKNGKPAPKIVLTKKIDGHYYVVEAGSDAKKHRSVIVTAYIDTPESLEKNIKKGNIIRVADVVNDKSSNPLLTANTGHESNFLDNIITDSSETVNDITDYKKLTIPNHSEMNKQIDKIIGMYGDDAVKGKAIEFKNSINKFLAENTEEAWGEVADIADELDRMLKGKTYTFKNQRKSKNKSNVQQAKYNKEIRDILTTETDSIMKEAEENALKNGKVSKARINTLENSGINTDDELSNKYLNEDNFKYQEISEKQSMEEATTRVSLNPEHWKSKIMAQEELSGVDIDTMMMIYTDTVKNARQTGDDELWKEAGAIFKKIQEGGTKGGQLIQAFAKWSRNTPEGIVAETFRKAKEEAGKVIGDKKAQKLIDELYEDAQKEIYSLANVAYSKGLNSRDAQIAFAKIGKIVNANTPKTVTGAIKTYLMDSMLLNFRTLISRNAAGNLGYNTMEFARQPITAAIDRGVGKITGKRTRTGWSVDKINSAFEGLAKGISEEVDDIKNGVHTAKSGENTIQNAIQLNAHALKGTNPVSNAINKIDDLTKHMLSIGDRPFYEAAYKQRMAELTDLRKRGLLGDDISNMSDADFNAFAELSAKMDGLTATYQDDGAMAKAFSSMKKAVGDYSKGQIGFDALSQFAMPFTRTPGNIITRSLEYSPLGTVKNAVNTANEIRRNEFDQQRFVDELGRNILGTGLVAGGIAAYDKGLMTGSYSDDKDMKNAQKNSGMQEYALRTNIGGKEGNFDVSWIPVLGNNLIMAAATKEAFDKGETTTDAISKAASASADALLNTSTLQGLNRVFGGNASYNTENNLFENAKDALTSGFGQAIPSLLRQVAQSTDKYERNINEGDRKYWQNSMINSIPGLREKMLQPKVDNEGNLILQNQGRSTAGKLLENMVSPGKYTEITNSPINTESMRLFESTGNNYSFLPTASRTDIANDDFEPTDVQYREYQQKLGGYNSKLAGALIDSSYYKALSDEGKEKELQNVYKAMKAVAKKEMLPNYETDDKIAEAYMTGGVQGAIAYMEKKNAFDTYDVSMSGKKAQEAYANGGIVGLEEYVTFKNAAESLGLNINSDSVNKVYEAGGIPYLKQYSTYKTGADADGNGSLKKKEVTSYLDSTGLSINEKRYWFSVLYAGTGSNPY